MRIVCLSLLAVSLLSAQQPPPGQPPRPPRQRGPRTPNPDPGHELEQRMTRALGLSAEQQNRVHTILTERDVATKGSAQQMRDLNTSLLAAVKAGNEGQIDQISRQLSDLHNLQTSAHAKSISKIYAALTPSQQAMVGNNLGMLMRDGTGRGGPGPGFQGPRPRRGGPPPQGGTPGQPPAAVQ
jgi:Spy/CpxP family protein refolding chaperone